MDAKCPKCEKVATLNDDVTKVNCPHCNFEASYDEFDNETKTINMAADYIPDRPGM